MQLRPGTETIRFRRPTAGPNAQQQGGTDVDKFGGKHGPDIKGWKRRHMGLLQDLVGRQSNGPFLPGFSFAVRLLLLVRVGAAMYANIQDCDEGESGVSPDTDLCLPLAVFNFFEPLHYFQYNTGFQTWELSPEYAVRSWAYILLHWPFAHILPTLMSLPKVSPRRLVKVPILTNPTASVLLLSPNRPRRHLFNLRSKVLPRRRGECE